MRAGQGGRAAGAGWAAPVSGAAGWRRSTPAPSATSASPSRRLARASSSARSGATGGDAWGKGTGWGLSVRELLGGEGGG